MKAALQAADLVHYSSRKFNDAYKMYKVLLRSDWLKGKAKSEIQAELAATLLELMDSGNKGAPLDVRLSLKLLYQKMDTSFPEPMARIELMYSETYFWQNSDSLGKAQAYSEYLKNKYKLFPQIASQATWNEAVALDRLGRTQDAKDLIVQVLDIEIPSSQKFRNRLNLFSMQEQSERFLARLDKKLGHAPRMINSNDSGTTSALNIRVPGITSNAN